MKIVKRFLGILAILLTLFVVLMLIPRLIAVLSPEKAPVGYRFEMLDYLAVGVGLEKLIDMEPGIPETVEEIKGIEYKNVDGISLQLDLYKPGEMKQKAPLLVFIHGGGWRGGERSDYLRYLTDYAEKGYVTATVSYRLVRDGLYPSCVEDIKDAVDWFFTHGDVYGYDEQRIALIGGSAGGHLSLLGGYGWGRSSGDSPNSGTAASVGRIKAVVDIYGPVDLTTDYARAQPLVTRFIGHSYPERPELYLEASPLRYIDAHVPPTLIFHGTSDNLVPVRQSDMLKSRLDALGVPCEYYRLPLWPHTMDIVQRVNGFVQQKMDAFLEKYL